MIARLSLSFIVMATSSIWSFAQGSSSFTSFAVPSAAVSQPGTINERHLQPTSVGSLYANSAFAHGYRHGYDEGFHSGDFALQLGRTFDLTSMPKQYRQSAHDYRPLFGSRQSFDEGYRAGFGNGYSDAIAGGEYQVNTRVRMAAAGLSAEVLSPSRRAHFDEGVASGYRSAQSPNAPGRDITAEYVEQYCRKTSSGAYALEYCSGFSRGYLLGISNATDSQIPKSAPTNTVH